MSNQFTNEPDAINYLRGTIIEGSNLESYVKCTLDLIPFAHRDVYGETDYLRAANFLSSYGRSAEAGMEELTSVEDHTVPKAVASKRVFEMKNNSPLLEGDAMQDLERLQKIESGFKVALQNLLDQMRDLYNDPDPSVKSINLGDSAGATGHFSEKLFLCRMGVGFNHFFVTLLFDVDFTNGGLRGSGIPDKDRKVLLALLLENEDQVSHAVYDPKARIEVETYKSSKLYKGVKDGEAAGFFLTDY